MLALFQNFGLPEILLLLLIVALLFGARRIGDIGKGLGEGIRNFREGIKSGSDKPGSESGTDHSKDTPH